MCSRESVLTFVCVCRMAVDVSAGDWDGRWNHVKKFLERSGPFTHPDFEPSTEVRTAKPVKTYLVVTIITI